MILKEILICEDEVLTANKIIAKLKSEIHSNDVWDNLHFVSGNLYGKNKSNAVTVELYTKMLDANKYLPAKKGTFYSNHKFVLQATFYATPPKVKSELKWYKAEDRTSIWLNQGGQIIGIGKAGETKYTNGDLNSFIDALKKTMSTDPKLILDELYKSGYNTYGRA